MAQWRRQWLEQGALVAWLTLDAQDDPFRFVRGLLNAMRAASGRAIFDTVALQFAERPDRGLDSLTDFLAEIANLATPTVLMLDDAERLPDLTAREALAYLLFNAPPNLRVVIGSRTALPLPTSELAAHGNFVAFKAQDLRFELAESIAILQRRFGQRLSIDDCAQLHEATEGWPIGLQLAAASIERAPDLHAAIETLSARNGDIERYFIESLFSRIPAPIADFLTRIAILEFLTPEICEAVTGCPAAAAYLDQLTNDTPVMIVAELRDWIRLHPLARDFLLGRFEKLPAIERNELHLRAARWLAERQRFHEAGRHALAAGDAQLALTYAETCLWGLVKGGKLAEAREWLAQLPGNSQTRDVRLRLAVGWIMALGDRPEEALDIAEQLAKTPGMAPELMYEAALISGAAAAYADRLGRIDAALKRWSEPPMSLVDPILTVAQANIRALHELHLGATESVRQIEAPFLASPQNETLLLALAHGRMLVGLSHLWDGNMYKAEAAVHSALLNAERQYGRRSVPAATYASVLAAALFERNQPEAAQALLAHRLDVVVRHGIPDCVLFAYRTLTYVALDQGDVRRALGLLDELHALGEARGMPRLNLFAIAERIRIHSLASRKQTVDGLIDSLDALAGVFAQSEYLPLLPQYQLSAAIAKSYAALARLDLDAADRELAQAHALAKQLRRGRDVLTVMVLRAVTAWQRQDPGAMALLSEALSLAAIGGSDRLLVDIHPIAVRMGATQHATAESNKHTQPASEARPIDVSSHKPTLPVGGLLTPKETEVLALLNSGLSNKLIARTMDIGDGTVKWHMKNLFSKLSAGTRRHAVDRARLLGLVSTER